MLAKATRQKKKKKKNYNEKERSYNYFFYGLSALLEISGLVLGIPNARL